jgi:hypothetical protein
MKTFINQTVFVIAFILVFSQAAFSQQETTILEKLKGTVWNAVEYGDGTYDCQFTDSTMVWTFGNSKEYSIVQEFYLSNNINNEFQIEKVGRFSSGNYLIIRAKRTSEDTRPKPISVMEIIELTNERLVLRNVNKPELPLVVFKAIEE